MQTYRLALSLLVTDQPPAAALAALLKTELPSNMSLLELSLHPNFDNPPMVTAAVTPSASPPPAAPSEESQTGEPPPAGKIRIMKKAEAKLVEAGTTAQAAIATGLTGSGKDGMITQADVDGWLKGRSPATGGNGEAIEFSTVRAELGKVVQKHGAEKATELLSGFHVEKVSALGAEHYPAFMKKVAEALAG